MNTKDKLAPLRDWLANQAKQDTLRFITCGSVDDGKSTLIGRLLWESRQIFDDQLESLQNDSRRFGTQGDAIDFALLVDGLVAEREQGITIDVAYRYFSTPKRKFIVADTPGHEQYTRNMVTGASTAALAIILVNAQQGVQTQTRRHAYLASLMGIKNIVLAINKMDLVAYDQNIFATIEAGFRQLSQPLGFTNITAIPLAALKGDNITSRSKNTPWYAGPTLMACLETAQAELDDSSRFVFPVQWVNRPDSEFRGFSGSVASGSIQTGATIRVTASGQTAQVKRLVTFNHDVQTANAGDAVTLVLDKEIDVSRGDVLSTSAQPLEMTDQFSAQLIWLHEDAGLVGRNYEIKLANQWARATITAIKHTIDISTTNPQPAKELGLNDIAVCNLALSRPLVFDRFTSSQALGSFILVDQFSQATIAAGLIQHNLRRAQNVHRQQLNINRPLREKLGGHKGKVIWFTGLSGSGKSTIANALEQQLYAMGRRTYILDGDNLRQGLNKDLGFTEADRVENIRRVAEVAKLMLDAGLIVMTAFISPFRAERQMASELIGAENFVEIFVDTPLEVCEERDPKGLYLKARKGEIPNMTGIGSPYEAPDKPALVINTASDDMQESIRAIMQLL